MLQEQVFKLLVARAARVAHCGCSERDAAAAAETCRISVFAFEMPQSSAQAFKLVVGRAQRNVDAFDAMPQLPPLSDFTPTPWGRWMPPNTTVNTTYLVQVNITISRYSDALGPLDAEQHHHQLHPTRPGEEYQMKSDILVEFTECAGCLTSRQRPGAVSCVGVFKGTSSKSFL